MNVENVVPVSGNVRAEDRRGMLLAGYGSNFVVAREALEKVVDIV